ncbi:serine hydrolase domain-containing protein [Aeromicrobium chenweiae]|uniref:Esterase n=1 Tax=Aeromicrobium chenweiae TaxID=2079793 RepID=A0A2S0WHP0_9ACTN|nr:serine hydrolase domain-containing protein [Aeromicrobium chenweiae]AWB90849.1 esterase [Aeromicrobium chenweiae]TGN31112.1 class A beta-lactamase-related serine hydrolase [Aeromicrobium chenweiae]
MHRIDSTLTEARERGVFSAAAWSHGTAEGPSARGLVGTLSWDGPAVEEHSRWDLASVTKPIVAIAVMSLVESGHLTLDDTIADHLPDYAGTDKATLTVRQLLSHTSGIPGQVPLYASSPTREEMLTAIRELPLLGPPDTAVVYSSQGFIVLGLMAEAASGLPLDRLVAERVSAPAGMPDTAFGVPDAQQRHAVATEDDPWRGTVVQGQVHDENAVVLGAPAGHAGLFSTLADMEQLGRTLCAEGRGRDGRMLSPAGHRTMIEPRTDHLNLRRSLGWQGQDATLSPAGDLIGPRGYGHTGFTGTSLWVDPDAGRYVVLLTNRVHPSRTGDAIVRVRRQVHNLALADS